MNPESIASSASRKTGFNVPLNGLRGLCALMVFVFHAGAAGVMTWPTGSWVAAGSHAGTSLAYGVELFFMISGFVILGSLLRHATVGGFLKDRAIRIFSAWVPAVVVIAVAGVLLDMSVFGTTEPVEAVFVFLANLLLLPPFVPVPLLHFGSWSLSYEWVFYLSAAAGVILHRRSGGGSCPMLAWGTAVSVFVMLYPAALFFLTGVIVFRYREHFDRRRGWLRMPLLSLVIFLLAWRATEVPELGNTLMDWLLDGRWLAAAVAFVASLHFFAAITLDAGREFRFLQTPAFQFLGRISYSFYLWHAIVMAAVKRVVLAFLPAGEGAFVLFLLATFALTVGVSWLSWRIFETAIAGRLRGSSVPNLVWKRAHA